MSSEHLGRYMHPALQTASGSSAAGSSDGGPRPDPAGCAHAAALLESFIDPPRTTLEASTMDSRRVFPPAAGGAKMGPMVKKTRSKVDDLRGATRLAVEATQGVTAVIEEMHRTIGSGPRVLGRPLEVPVRWMTRMVYGSIRGVTGVVGASMDLALEQLARVLGENVPIAEQDALVAALNGVLGDYLAETDNPLAIEMQLRCGGEPLDLDDPGALGATIPNATGKLLVMVHGSCMSDRQWLRNGHDHGEALARDLAYTRVDVLYNSGLHVSSNGNAMAALLERLASTWPVPIEEIVIVTHSMGGLVSRSACRTAELAEHGWRRRLRSMVFIGTPHHGAPLERGGHRVDTLLGVSPYSAPLARLGRIRSAGVTDLRFGNVLEEHWQGRDRFETSRDLRSPVPLPSDVDCYAVAGSGTSGTSDGLVPVESALGRHRDPELTLVFPRENTLIVAEAGHLDLLGRAEVYEKLREWLSRESEDPGRRPGNVRRHGGERGVDGGSVRARRGSSSNRRAHATVP